MKNTNNKKRKSMGRFSNNSIKGEQHMIVKHDNKSDLGNFKNKKNRSIVIAIGAGNFYSDAEHIAQALKNHGARLNIKPVIEIDPKSVVVEKPIMTDSEKAFMLARKYKWQDPTYTLKQICSQHRKKEMSEKTIKIVFEMVDEIKNATKTRP